MKMRVKNRDGQWHDLDGTHDLPLMRTITAAGLDMEASCDGEMACSTCHVSVDPEWFARLEPAVEEESDMLDYSAKKGQYSRLSCQIKMSDKLDGIKLEIIGE